MPVDAQKRIFAKKKGEKKFISKGSSIIYELERNKSPLIEYTAI